MRDAFGSNGATPEDKDLYPKAFELAVIQSGYATAEQIDRAMQVSREKRILFVYALETVIERSLPREMVRLYMRSRSHASSRVVTEIHSRSNPKITLGKNTLDKISSPNLAPSAPSPNLNIDIQPSQNLVQNPAKNSEMEELMFARQESRFDSTPKSHEKLKRDVPTSQVEHPIENLIGLILKWAADHGESEIQLEPQVVHELKQRYQNDSHQKAAPSQPVESTSSLEQQLQKALSELATTRDRLTLTQQSSDQATQARDHLSDQLVKLKQELSKRDRQLAAQSSKYEQELAQKEQQLNHLFQELLQVRAELIAPDQELGVSESSNSPSPQPLDLISQEQLQTQLLQKEVQVKTEIFKRLLVTLDVFDLAIHQVKPQTDREQSIHASYQRLREKLLQDLQQFGVLAMETTGQTFDPTLHEAVIAQPTDQYTEGTIMAEIRRGYLFQERVLRYAQVKVAVSNL
jgi:hypothetical protein